jgi:hypothetical protein
MVRARSKWIAALLWLFSFTSLLNGVAMYLFPSAWFFRLVPGVPETGPFNAHLVMDGGTFYLAIGVGLAAAAIEPRRNAIAVVIAAIADILHSLLHVYSHAAGLLSYDHLTTEVIGIYVPAVALTWLAIAILRGAPITALNSKIARAEEASL